MGTILLQCGIKPGFPDGAVLLSSVCGTGGFFSNLISDIIMHIDPRIRRESRMHKRIWSGLQLVPLAGLLIILFPDHRCVCPGDRPL